MCLAPRVVSPAEFLMSAIKTIIKHKMGGTIQAAAILHKTHPNYLTIPGPCLAAKSISLPLPQHNPFFLCFSLPLQSHIALQFL